jgi:undecaprenyl-diphosphatase
MSAPMRDDSAGSVTPGGQPAPLGARGGSEKAEAGGTEAARPRQPDPARGAAAGAASATHAAHESPIARLGGSTRLLVGVLVASLVAYAAVAADVVNGGWASVRDVDVATWVARSMPAWAEWLARPFTWIGGVVGVTAVVVTAVVLLLTRRARAEAALLVVVVLGAQLLVATAKNGYDRPRPDAGSAIALPSSYSFPSGHATTGIAVFGLLGLLVAARARTRRAGRAAVAAGFALAALIGASRVVLGVHYVTDVVAGACLGLAWLTTCLLAARLIVRRRPVADPG